MNLDDRQNSSQGLRRDNMFFGAKTRRCLLIVACQKLVDSFLLRGDRLEKSRFLFWWERLEGLGVASRFMGLSSSGD